MSSCLPLHSRALPPAVTPQAGRSGPDEGSMALLLAACARRHGVPGAQLAWYADGRTLTAEYGVVEHGTGRPVTADTAFPAGSVTKVATATAVLALAADDDVDLDEPVGRLVPGLPHPAADVTARQLLSHTAGLPCGPAAEEVAGLSVPAYLSRVCDPLHRVVVPGTGFSYSNAGYVLLGRLLSAITGMSWADMVTALVLDPLGVPADMIGLPGWAGSGRAVATGHSAHARTGRIRPVLQSLSPAEAAAGALALSASDLVALGRPHVDGGVPAVLPPRLAELMRTVVPGAVPFGLAQGWGLGLAAFGAGPHPWSGHDGNADGTAAYLRIDPAGSRIVALTCTAGSGYAMWTELSARLRAFGLPLGPTETSPKEETGLFAAGDHPGLLPARTAPLCAGSYRNGDVEYLVTEAGPHGLQLGIDGEAPENIVVRADLSFLMEDAATGGWSLGGRFVRDHPGRVMNGIQVGGRLAGRRIAAFA